MDLKEFIKCNKCGADCEHVMINAYTKGKRMCCFCANLDEEELCNICKKKLEVVIAALSGKKVIIVKEINHA